jgi:DNA repair photolyase
MNYYKEFISFKSIFYFCALPLRLDSYNGCTYNCLYCFSQCLNNRNQDKFKKPKPANPHQLEKLLASSSKNQTNQGVVSSCLKRRIPIHFGNVSDPFQPIERSLRISYDFLQILKKYNYPTVISTKSTLLTSSEYLALILDFPTSVQVSFSTFDERLAEKVEPNAPSPQERLQLVERLSNVGIWTVVRIQPFLFPKENISNIPISALASAGTKHVMVEHLRIPTNSSIHSRKILFLALGMDFLDEYRKRGIMYSRVNYELSSSEKLDNILLFKEEVHKNGMTFGSADNDYHHVSDAPCCCGLPSTPDFANYYSGNIGFSLYNSFRTGRVSFDEIDANWQPSGSIREFLNSDCRLLSHVGPVDYLKAKIQNPYSSNSPTSFNGIIFDKCKNCYIIEQEFRNKFFPN